MIRLKKRFLALFGAAVFAILVWKLDLRLAAEKIANVAPSTLLFSIGLFGLGQFLGFLKYVTMKKKTLPEGRLSIAQVYSSIFVTGMLMPARSGDLIASLAWRSYQGRLLAWSILNRILEGGMTILTALAVLGFFFSGVFSGFRTPAFLLFSVAAGFGIFAVFRRSWGLAVMRAFKRLLVRFESFPIAAQLLAAEKKIAEQVHLFYDTLSEMKAGKCLVVLILLTALARLCTVMANFYLLHALGADLRLGTVVGILAVTWISCFFSLTPNGIGISDLPPSLMLGTLGYGEFAGGFVIMSRCLELVIMAFWAFIWTVGARGQKTAEKLHEYAGC